MINEQLDIEHWRTRLQRDGRVQIDDSICARLAAADGRERADPGHNQRFRS